MMLFSLAALLALPAPDKTCNLSTQWGSKVPKKTANAYEVRDGGGQALWGFIRASDTSLEDFASGAGRDTPHRRSSSTPRSPIARWWSAMPRSSRPRPIARPTGAW